MSRVFMRWRTTRSNGSKTLTIFESKIYFKFLKHMRQHRVRKSMPFDKVIKYDLSPINFKSSHDGIGTSVKSPRGGVNR